MEPDLGGTCGQRRAENVSHYGQGCRQELPRLSTGITKTDPPKGNTDPRVGTRDGGGRGWGPRGEEGGEE